MRAKEIFMIAMMLIGICNYGSAQTYSQSLLDKAKSGDAKAQRDLGGAYMSGNNVQRDARQGLFWIKKSAVQGYAPACTDLGYCYSEGIGVDRNLAIGFEWFKKGADLGDAEAEFYVGRAYENGEGVSVDLVKARYWYHKSAINGYVTAQYNLGCLYANGKGGVQDYRKAVEWYEKAAYQGLDWAQINLGNCYYAGNGVTTDREKAKYLMRKAAEQNNMVAFYNLGSYYKDEETKDSYLLAITYYGKAAQLGHEKAKWNLPIVQTMLAPIYYEEGNIGETVNLLKSAVENKTNSPVGAMRALAVLYTIDGWKDPAKADYWLKRAEEVKAKNGNTSMEYK